MSSSFSMPSPLAVMPLLLPSAADRLDKPCNALRDIFMAEPLSSNPGRYPTFRPKPPLFPGNKRVRFALSRCARAGLPKAVYQGQPWRTKGIRRAGWHRAGRASARAARARRRSICGIRRFAAISTCGSQPTAPGSISRRRSDGRPGAAVRLGAEARRRQVFSGHAGREMGITVEDAPFLAVEMNFEDAAGPHAAFPHQCR